MLCFVAAQTFCSFPPSVVLHHLELVFVHLKVPSFSSLVGCHVRYRVRFSSKFSASNIHLLAWSFQLWHGAIVLAGFTLPFEALGHACVSRFVPLSCDLCSLLFIKLSFFFLLPTKYYCFIRSFYTHRVASFQDVSILASFIFLLRAQPFFIQPQLA